MKSKLCAALESQSRAADIGIGVPCEPLNLSISALKVDKHQPPQQPSHKKPPHSTAAKRKSGAANHGYAAASPEKTLVLDLSCPTKSKVRRHAVNGDADRMPPLSPANSGNDRHGFSISESSCSSSVSMSAPSLSDNNSLVIDEGGVAVVEEPVDTNAKVGGKHKKKARTTFTGRQIFELEKQFEVKKYLSSSERTEMAKLLAVTETQVTSDNANELTSSNASARQLIAALIASVSCARVCIMRVSCVSRAACTFSVLLRSPVRVLPPRR